ncbi:gem-associated protein 5 isoform X2 [Salarias fasciatus]|uniref:gem-associated protein 5 isoform X2 n=1 Tax=Salarias fasciatus TaxID=181472 RepID=UPI001176EA6E|nr:gem-associated protein 5 isoform X2 [Salarias fasciatus]
MHERLLPASPNWYFSRCSDVSSGGLLGVGAKNLIYLIDVSASACRVSGKLVGHKDLVSGFSFCQQPGQSHLCVSTAVDGALRFWDSSSAELIREHAAHQNPISAVHWSPADKNLVVSGDEKGVVACHWYHTGDAASFFPEPRPVFCLSCSPHSWSLVAVGYKDGMIVLIDVSKKGEVIHRLRGHDDEIHSLAWAPRAHEDALCHRPEDGEAANGVSAAEEKGCFLASGSRDQTVRIWSSARGKGVMTLKLPYLKRRGSAVDPGVKERLWLHVHWPKGRATQLVSSCFSGELLLWDLTRGGKQRWTLLGASAEGQNHSRIVFNMSSVQLQDRELLLSTSMDREIKCWDLASLDCCWTLPTMGGTVYALTFSPVGLGCLAVGVGDNMIRVWNTLSTQNQHDIRTLWQGIRCKVSALAWHPTREGSLAFGTDDGKVGIYDVFANKPPQISSSYHRKTVYTLAWGPPVPPLSSGKPAALSLYSCAGEGVILQHDPSNLSGEASDIDRLIRDTNDIKHKLSPHTDLSWKPDGSVVAVGNEDGCIEVFQAPDLRLLCSIQQHHKTINALRWHPGAAAAAAGLHGLLASGSSNAVVYVHDLRSVIENPPESPAVLTEPYRRLAGQTAKITGLAWSPHHSARLVTASYDGTAQVWDVLEEAAVANYRGHVGFLLSVDWSPVDPDVVWTGGRDFTVQEWRVSRQEFTKPPMGKKMAGLKEKMKTNPQLKKKKTKKKQEESGEGAAATPEPGGDAGWRRREPSEDDEKDEASSSSSSVPASETPNHSSAMTAKPRDKPDAALLKKKKPRSLLPLSTAMDHLPKETQLQDCVALASLHSQQAPPAGCVPGRGEHVHLGLFTDRQALHRLLETEEQGHVEAGHYDSVVYLRLWSGDLQGALQLATERGELNDHLLSVAPMAGFEAWRRAVEAFVQQLCLQEQYLKAASHLLSLSRVYEAVELLRSHKLYREAVALAKARLPPEDPVLKELFTSWAAALEKDGHLSAAAKCHLAAGAGFDAAKVISRKSDATSMRAAATVARLSGEDALARSLSLRCAKTLAVGQDWTAAQEVLSAQEGLLVHQLHLSVAELLTASLEGSGVIPATPCASCHTWASPSRGGGGFLDRVREVWDEQWGVSAGQAGVLLQELKSSDCPPPSSSVPLPQVLLYSSLHVTLGVLGWLQGGGARLLRELWAALSWTREAGLFSVSAELCRMLFPHGDVRVCSTQDLRRLQLEEEEEEAEAAAGSLQAFVLYHRLYEDWWAGSAGPGGPGVPNGEWTGSDGVPDASLLLSEPHASLQSSQRAVRQIQERLSSMVTQHSRARGREDPERRPGGEPGSAPDSAGAGERPADQDQDQDQDQDSLLSLSSSMAEHQQRLADLPHSVKMFARPDVVECCLLLLHRSKSSPPLSDDLQRRARDLLRRYGNTPSVQKASRRFLT